MERPNEGGTAIEHRPMSGAVAEARNGAATARVLEDGRGCARGEAKPLRRLVGAVEENFDLYCSHGSLPRMYRQASSGRGSEGTRWLMTTGGCPGDVWVAAQHSRA